MKVTACTFNCALSVGPPLRWNGAKARAHRLVPALYNSCKSSGLDIPDLILLQELIVYRSTVLNAFKHGSHPYNTPEMKQAPFSSRVKIWPSGLAIVSRWPIVEYRHHRFETTLGYHLERLTARGCVYAKILHPSGRLIHVFVTHLNAWHTATARAARAAQASEIGDFVEETLRSNHVNSNRDMVLLGGDMNVDLFHTTERRAIENAIGHNCDLEPAQGRQPSFSPSDNELVGVDDPAEYACTDRCYAAFLATGKCDGAPHDLLDAITRLGCSGSKSGRPFRSRTIQVTTQVPFMCDYTRTFKKEVNHVSDHAAVVSVFVQQKHIDSPEKYHHHCYHLAVIGLSTNHHSRQYLHHGVLHLSLSH